MERYKIEGLTFTYPLSKTPAIDNISFAVHEGEFLTICGKSGCGKSTLLRQLKPALMPHGIKSGTVYFDGKSIDELDFREQSAKIGFVIQNPDNQIVTDKVWHELAFGLESLGVKTPEIRTRVAEMASFFGIQTWFHKNVSELSGGQKQLLNLASVMVMQPSVLILDEPTSQLDPIAAQDFLETVSKINRELGITVILTEHRLEEAFALSDRVIVMDGGKIIADAAPDKIAGILRDLNSDMLEAMPTAARVFTHIDAKGKCPVTVREGRLWLDEFSKEHELVPVQSISGAADRTHTPLVELKNVHFRYDKNAPDVLRGVSTKIYGGEIYAIVGGNGAGKTTALSVISGINAPQRGSVLIGGQKPSEINDLYGRVIGVMPQNPQSLFVKKTVREDLYEILSDRHMKKPEQDVAVTEVINLCELADLLDRHPYDLSGGEQQRAALAKLLLLRPKILLLDEPTKGLDAHFKEKLADVLTALKNGGATVILVSHDVEFCARYADRCAMLFDGAIVSEGAPREFFAGKSFYTTAANRMARHILPEAVLAEDIIAACGGSQELRTETKLRVYEPSEVKAAKPEKRMTKPKIIQGAIFAVLFIISAILCRRTEGNINLVIQLLSLVFAGISLYCFIPKRLLGTDGVVKPIAAERRIDRRTIAGAAAALIAIPLTIYIGTYYLGDRKYYFISLLIILETLIPFALMFERRRPRARELVLISVLCAIAIAGRAAFFMLPQFKPLAAVVIIAGACMGAETGFLVGAISGFVSNFFFGQGPLTPWQMFAFGLIGFFAGLIFRRAKTKGGMCVYGFFSVLVIYGGLMNPASIIIWQPDPTWEMILAGCVMGLPFDLLHAAATVFFLFFAAEPMSEKLERIKEKYGIIKQ